MDLVSYVRAVITGTYQGACHHSVAVAMAMCVKLQEHEGEIPAADMAAMNAAVEPVIPVSVETATAFCEVVWHIAWNAGADEQNRITAGVATVERVLLAMTSHVGDADVQKEGACALADLVSCNSVNLAGMLALGGLKVLIAAADIHIASRNVQGGVGCALYCIARDSSDGRMALRASRAAEVATRAKDLYPDLWSDELLRTLSAE